MLEQEIARLFSRAIPVCAGVSIVVRNKSREKKEKQKVNSKHKNKKTGHNQGPIMAGAHGYDFETRTGESMANNDVKT